MINQSIPLESVIESLEISDSAYEKAESRYQDIGEWLGNNESSCSSYKPHVFSQGSFRLGTVIRPLSGNEEYDLDLGCKFQNGISKKIHTQHQVKHLLGSELEKYRKFRGIEEQMEEKHRCWRLFYKDHLKFHMDIVPCIPEEQTRRQSIKEAMIREGIEGSLAHQISEFTVSITDDRHSLYDQISSEWQISNTEGYARWFEERMKQAKQYIQERTLLEKASSIEAIPVYRWKTPLQRCIQLLKRHRDVMYKDDPERKPISIIITTLAAHAYSGEKDISEAITNILNKMGGLISTNRPRVPNPVDPSEDFADRWVMPAGQKLQLEKNFRLWLSAAAADFKLICSSNNAQFIAEQASLKFKSSLDVSKLKKTLEVSGPIIITEPREYIITGEPAKPWSKYW